MPLISNFENGAVKVTSLFKHRFNQALHEIYAMDWRLEYVLTLELADILTKTLIKHKFENSVTALNVRTYGILAEDQT